MGFANATYLYPPQKGNHSTWNVACKAGNFDLLCRWSAEVHISLDKEVPSQTLTLPNADLISRWRGALATYQILSKYTVLQACGNVGVCLCGCKQIGWSVIDHLVKVSRHNQPIRVRDKFADIISGLPSWIV